MRFAFTVAGVPVPQGSLVKKGRNYVHDNADRLYPWRGLIAAAVRPVKPSGWDNTGPMYAELVFQLPRPGYHFDSLGRRKDDAAWFPTKRVGDIDRLSRAVLDALTLALVWLDDAQVVCLDARKVYADAAGLSCAVTRLSVPRVGG